LHWDLGGGTVDLAEFVGRQFDVDRSDILLQAVPLRGARDRHDPRLPNQQPRQGELGQCRLLPLGDLRQQIDQRLVLGRPAASSGISP
jgi:hypothetical protein